MAAQAIVCQTRMLLSAGNIEMRRPLLERFVTNRRTAASSNPLRSYKFWLHRKHFTEVVDLSTTRGLEIGAMDVPFVEPGEGQCEFADYRTTEELRELAVIVDGHNEEFVVPVKYDLREGYGAITGKFDWIAASHVVEHVPNLSWWLNTLADLLVPGGLIFLVAPDKRFTFDYHRPITTLSDIVETAHLALDKPSFRQIFDHHYFTTTQIDPGILWRGVTPGAPALNYSGAYEVAERGRHTYEDAHCSVFTPESFAKLMHEATATGLIRPRLNELRSTQLNQLDFSVVLRV